MSNRKFYQLLLNVLSIAVATNNIQYPSVKVTKSYNTKQRVYFGSKVLGLQGAVKHNVKIKLSYYKATWPKTKYDLLLGDHPFEKVPMKLAKTFTVISKYHTTYKNAGISMSWTDRNECADMKHPHQIFLLQNIFNKITVVNVEQVRRIKFPERAKDDVDAWMQFFTSCRTMHGPHSQAVLGGVRGIYPTRVKLVRLVQKRGVGERRRRRSVERNFVNVVSLVC